jgi:nitrate reductase NapE component
MFKLKLYNKIFLFSILAVALIGIFDVWSMSSGIFGTPENYTAGDYQDGWWNLFFMINLSLLIMSSLSYYFFSRKDKSESISFLVGGLILWFTGLADVLYFWFQGKSIPLVLNHLNNSIVIGRISSLLSFDAVTNISLIISSVIGLIFAYFAIKFLVKKL